MNTLYIEEQLAAFSAYLQGMEKSRGTVENYIRYVRRFLCWLSGDIISREEVCRWKQRLSDKGYQSATINAMLVALNAYLKWLGKPECCVKTLRLQKRMFRDASRELTRQEYEKLIASARDRDKERLALLMETICATGIRVGEVGYITVEAVRLGYAEVRLKGKIRRILLPGKLRRKLRQYAKKQKIVSGEVFITRNGKGMNRRQIWAQMKRLCSRAGVETRKVFPHNLRHLFAVTFYAVSKDIARLADVLGHSSVETTRIYLLSNGAEHLKQMERLKLVL